MTNHIAGKSIVITGAGGGFGRLVAQKAAALGAKITCGDIDPAAAQATVDGVTASGGTAQAVQTDVRDLAAVKALVAKALEAYGAVDVMINNAGIMPLAFFSDHEAAYPAWERCIDINIKGVLNGMVAAYDPMIAAGRGQIVNLSSIYGNFPVIGAAVYGASKSAVNFLSEIAARRKPGQDQGDHDQAHRRSHHRPLRHRDQPRRRRQASSAHNMPEFMDMVGRMARGTFPAERLSPDAMDYASLAPDHIADAVIHVINQPLGVAISEMTVRAAGDHFVL